MHRLSLALTLLLVLSFGAAGLAHAQSQTAGCTPPPGTANIIVCFGSTPCPAGYIDPVGTQGRLQGANLLTRWLCQQPTIIEDGSSAANSTSTSTTASIPPVSAAASLPLSLTASSSVPPQASAPASNPSPAPSSRPAAPVAAAATTTVLVGSSDTAGTVLTNAQGMTLYTRTLDTAGTSTCTGSCAIIWLPYAPPSTSLSLPGNATGTLGLIVRDDGSLQVIYNGMPLYLYTGDFKPGDANGAGISDIYQVALP